MQLKIDETQQHIYISLKEGETAFKRARKSAEHLGLPVDTIDEQITVNKKLRKIFNPKAEEEAWAKQRKKRGEREAGANPNQTDLEEETKTVTKEGYEFVNPEATEVLSDDRLRAVVNRAQELVGAAGFALVGIDHVKALTSSTRESLERWARAVVIAHGNGSKLPAPSKALKVAVLNIMRELRAGGGDATKK